MPTATLPGDHSLTQGRAVRAGGPRRGCHHKVLEGPQLRLALPSRQSHAGE